MKVTDKVLLEIVELFLQNREVLKSCSAISEQFEKKDKEYKQKLRSLSVSYKVNGTCVLETDTCIIEIKDVTKENLNFSPSQTVDLMGIISKFPGLIKDIECDIDRDILHKIKADHPKEFSEMIGPFMKSKTHERVSTKDLPKPIMT